MQFKGAKVGKESEPKAPGSMLERAILEYLREHSRCTFAALVKAVPGCVGQFAVGTAFENLFLWRGMSKEAVEALFALEKMKHIRFECSSECDYGEDGGAPGLPNVLEPKDCDSPHWLPVLIHAKRRAKRSPKRTEPASGTMTA